MTEKSFAHLHVVFGSFKIVSSFASSFALTVTLFCMYTAYFGRQVTSLQQTSGIMKRKNTQGRTAVVASFFIKIMGRIV